MAKNNSIKTNMGYLGEDYQYLLVKYFIETPQFFVSLVSIIDQNMFTDEHLRRIVGMMKDRQSKNGLCPNYNDIELLIRTTVNDKITVDIMIEKLNSLKNRNFDIDIDLLTSNAEKFFKQQNLAKAINQCTEILKRGNADNYFNMEDIIKKALDTNTSTNLGFHLFSTLEDDLKEDYRCTIPTGADKLDESLFGGLGKGELGIIVSPMGVGKTSCTTGFCANAATSKTLDNNEKGYKVLHFFFEDTEVSIRRKYYGYVTDIDACDLSDPINRPIALKILKDNNNELRNMLAKNVICQRLTTGEYSASDIKYLIQQYISKGFIPDLVVVDYFECLKPEKNIDGNNETEWTREGITMRKLESIAKEFNLALWVPVQSTKDAINQEYVGLGQAGGSVKKTQIGHVVIQLGQTQQQKEDHRMNIFIGKLRAVKIGRTSFPNVKFNNGTCKFDMSDMDSIDNEPLANNNGNANNSFLKTANKIAKSTK
jgi:replicative DNA helicase